MKNTSFSQIYHQNPTHLCVPYVWLLRDQSVSLKTLSIKKWRMWRIASKKMNGGRDICLEIENGHQTGPRQTHGAPGPVPQQLVWQSWLKSQQSGAKICLRTHSAGKVGHWWVENLSLDIQPSFTLPVWAGSADTLLLIPGLDIPYESPRPSSKWSVEKSIHSLVQNIYKPLP